MGTNASVTALIAYKILSIYKDNRGFVTTGSTSVQASVHRKDLNPLVSILIDSGLITFIGRLIRSIMYYKSAFGAYPLARCVTMLYVRVSCRL